MKIKNKKTKGFTLVELLVVIAILAILATVSIIGYTNFINKANEANDLSVAEQMNIALQADEVTNGKPGNFNDVLNIAEDAGFILANLNPTTQGYHYVWDQAQNKFFLVDEEYNVIFPTDISMSNPANSDCWTTAKTTEEFTTLTQASFKVYGASDDIDYLAVYQSASGDITVSNSTVKVTNVNTEAELIMVGAMVNSAKDGITWEITLTGDIELTGDWSPLGKGKLTHVDVLNEKPDRWFEGTIDGGNHTISNLNASTNGILDNAGLISAVGGSGATIKNLTIDGGTISNPMDTAGAVIGCQFDGNVTIEEVNVKNMTITGEQAAGIIGCGPWTTTDDSLTISNCTVSGCTITGSYQVGGIVGGAYSCTLSIKTCTVSESTLICQGVTPQLSNSNAGRGVHHIGGIVGYAGVSTVTIASCSVNDSAVKVVSNATVKTNVIGIIVGAGGKEFKDCSSNSYSDSKCYKDGAEITDATVYNKRDS